MAVKYKRILLKISGEQLSGSYEGGLDAAVGGWLADEIKKAAQKTQIIIMVGGGNFVRGANAAGHGVKRVTADHMGMLGTMINALALTDIFEAHGIPTRCLSNIFAEQVAEPFIHRLANKHLEKGRVVIAAGGIGRPYFTTDTAAVALALELSCDAVLKATKVDGIYDGDPIKNLNAKRIAHLSYQQAVENPNIKVMDKAAFGLALDHQMPIIVFDALKSGNISGVIAGNSIGTTVS